MLDPARFKGKDASARDPALLYDLERVILSAKLTESLLSDLVQYVRARGIMPADLREVADQLGVLKGCVESDTSGLAQLTRLLSHWLQEAQNGGR